VDNNNNDGDDDGMLLLLLFPSVGNGGARIQHQNSELMNASHAEYSLRPSTDRPTAAVVYPPIERCKYKYTTYM